jgi:hypothetical protein
MDEPRETNPGDAADRLLRGAVRLLPAPSQDWGRAMQAELANMGPGPDRWRFAMGCARAVVTRPSALATIGQRVLAAGTLVGTLVLAASIPFAVIRDEAISMIAFLSGVFWLARRQMFFGPAADTRTARLVSAGGVGLLTIAVLLFINQIRLSPSMDGDGGPELYHATTLTLVWTTMLTLYLVTLLRMTARQSRVATRTLATASTAGALSALGWLGAVGLHSSVPSSNGPALLAISIAATVGVAADQRPGRLFQRLVSALGAAATTALMIAVMLDALPLLPFWVSNSAPPQWSPNGRVPVRLVDSIGVWLLGCLTAALLSLTIRSGSRRMPARSS